MKPIYVYLKQTRHKTQPWTFTIDKPGPQSKETKAERYVTAWSAKRGALRSLGAQPWFDEDTDDMAIGVYEPKTDRIRRVKFVYQRLTKK